MSKIILLADNLRDFLDVRREFLEQAGFTVVTADNPTDAGRILERGGVDLAVLDIRLVDDDDEGDTSGLELARTFGRAIPIIMLTGYPTWENIKAVLGRDLNGLSPAVDFLSKTEGPDLMIQAVNLTIEHPRLKNNVLQEFQAESSLAFHESLQKNEPAENSDKFQICLERTERDLLQHRREITQQYKRYQKTALWVGLTGIGMVVVCAVLVVLKITPLAILSGAAGIVSEAISFLFITRAVQALKQLDKNTQEQQELNKASHLISIADTIGKKSSREDTKILIIEKLIGKWFS